MVARRDPKPGLVCDSELVGCKFAGIRDLSRDVNALNHLALDPSNGLV